MLDIHYLESIGCENEYFCYIEEDCLDVFVEKIDEIFSDCGTFWEKENWCQWQVLKKKNTVLQLCDLCGEKVDKSKKIFVQVRVHCHYLFNLYYLICIIKNIVWNVKMWKVYGWWK